MTDEPVDNAPTTLATTHLHSSAHVHVALPAQDRGGVALVTIARPEVLNALSFEVVGEIADAFETLDGHPGCRVIVLTGDGERAFAAGADIKELAVQNPTDLAREDPFTHWDRIRRVRKPIVAAVRGFAWVVAASWRWPATSSWPGTTRSSVSPRSSSGSCPARAVRNA